MDHHCRLPLCESGSATKRRLSLTIRDLPRFCRATIADFSTYCWFSLRAFVSPLRVRWCTDAGAGTERNLGLIGRGPLRRSHVLAVSVLTAGLVWAGFVTYPSPVVCRQYGSSCKRLARRDLHRRNGATSEQATNATTVGEFLARTRHR